MKENKINCEHACKNTCATLEEAINWQEGLVLLYEKALGECSIPDITDLMKRMLDNSKKVKEELEQKLNEVKSTSGIIDDIEKSYDKNEM